MTAVHWIGYFEDWTTAADWSDHKVPGAADDVTINNSYEPKITSHVPTIHSLAIENDGLEMDGGAGLTVTAAMSVTANLVLEDFGSAPITLSVGGVLTNGAYGDITAQAQEQSINITAGSFKNFGYLSLTGGPGFYATMNVKSAAGFGTAGVVTGKNILFSTARIVFAKGEIRSIAAKSVLSLTDATASVSDSGGAVNSALRWLGAIGAGGDLDLNAGATVATTGGLTNSGEISMDYAQYGGPSGVGGSKLVIGGALINKGEVAIEPWAKVDVVSAKTLTNSGVFEFVGVSNGTVSVSIAGAATNSGRFLIGESDFTDAAGVTSDYSSSAATLSAASYHQTAGLTVVDGVLNAGAVISGGVIEGTGKTQALIIDKGAKLEAGQVAVVPTVGGKAVEGPLKTGKLTLESGAIFQEDIGYPNVPAAGGHESVDVTGAVSIGGAKLEVSVGSKKPTAGERLIIINNDGTDAIVGRFAGLAQGARFDAGGFEFAINYAGGTGNDVVLTVIGAVKTTAEAVAVSPSLSSADTGLSDSLALSSRDSGPAYFGHSTLSDMHGLGSSRDLLAASAMIFRAGSAHGGL